MRRSFANRRILVAGVATLVTVGCTAEDRTEPDRASTLTILVGPGDYRAVTPVVGNADMHLIYSTLFRPFFGKEPEPGLVRAWEHTDDFREWTFHLRTDVQWHDGVPLTARDVAFTFDLLNDQAVLRGNSLDRTVTVLDDSTFTVRRLKPGDPVLDDWTPILPQHLLGGLDPEEFSEWEAWTHPVGTGPYSFVRYEPRTGIELEANPEYFLGKPQIDRIVVKLGGTAWADLESGAVDVTGSPPPEALFRLAGDPRFRVYWRPARNMGIVWNHANPLFQDVRVRRALTHAIDRQSMKVALDYPPDFPLVDFPATVEQMIRGDFPDPYPYDAELARELLLEAGWRDEDGDGVLERGGMEFRFRLLSRAESEPMALLVKDQLSKVGVAVEIELSANQVVRGRLREGDFDGIIERTDVSILVNRSDGLPWVGYDNAEVRRLLAERDASFDPAADEDANRAMWPIFWEDHPATPLIPLPRYTIANVRVKGLRSPDRVWPGTWAAQLWLEEDWEGMVGTERGGGL